MNHQRRQRSVIDSFIEGFVAPWVELAVSLIVVAGSKAVELMQEAFRLLQQAFNAASFGSVASVDFIALFTFVIFVMSVIDLARNLLVGFLYPGHAIAHIGGEALSLIIFFNALILISRSVIVNCLLAIMLLAVGVCFRFYVEYERSEVEYWGY